MPKRNSARRGGVGLEEKFKSLNDRCQKLSKKRARLDKFYYKVSPIICGSLIGIIVVVCLASLIYGLCPLLASPDRSEIRSFQRYCQSNFSADGEDYFSDSGSSYYVEYDFSKINQRQFDLTLISAKESESNSDGNASTNIEKGNTCITFSFKPTGVMVTSQIDDKYLVYYATSHNNFALVDHNYEDIINVLGKDIFDSIDKLANIDIKLAVIALNLTILKDAVDAGNNTVGTLSSIIDYWNENTSNANDFIRIYQLIAIILLSVGIAYWFIVDIVIGKVRLIMMKKEVATIKDMQSVVAEVSETEPKEESADSAETEDADKAELSAETENAEPKETVADDTPKEEE